MKNYITVILEKQRSGLLPLTVFFLLNLIKSPLHISNEFIKHGYLLLYILFRNIYQQINVYYKFHTWQDLFTILMVWVNYKVTLVLYWLCI